MVIFDICSKAIYFYRLFIYDIIIVILEFFQNVHMVISRKYIEMVQTSIQKGLFLVRIYQWPNNFNTQKKGL
jgi:hypothetical protein